MEASERPDLEPNSHGNSPCDLFRHLKLIEEGELIESDEDMVLLCRASGSSTQAQSSSTGLYDPMAAYLSEEFKAFLEKRGTYKELERVVSKGLLKLLKAKKADGSPLFVVKPNSTQDQNMSLTESAPSLIDILDQDPSTTETTTGTSDIPEREQSSHLQIGQQETPCSQESIHANLSECLRKIAFDIPNNVKTGLQPNFVNRRRLSQIPPRYTGRLPAASATCCGSDSTVTVQGILQAALSSLNRQTRRETALSHKLGMIVSPLTGSR